MSNQTILVIDDDAMVRRTVEKILKGAGYGVKFAENGAEGLRNFSEVKPDLVITDILMPEQNGVDAIIGLRKFWNGPILAISGGAAEQGFDLMNIVPKLGADATLRKPFSPEQLLKSVETCLEKVYEDDRA